MNPLRHPRRWWERQKVGFQIARDVSRDLMLRGVPYAQAVKRANEQAARKLHELGLE